MTRPTMRRLVLSFLAALSVVSLPSAAARAQEETAGVRLTLLSQTPWNTTTQRELVVRIRAENLGAFPIGELSIGVELFGRVTSRTAYEQALATDPIVGIKGDTLPREGSLDPGVPRDFEFTFLLDTGMDPDDSGVYPFRIDLRSGFTSLAAIRTPVVFLVRTPELPLVLSWTHVVHHPITFGPDGVFTSRSLEASLEPGGRLAAQIGALLDVVADPGLPEVDVAISPVLLTQLQEMSDGYTVSTELEERDVPPDGDGAVLARGALADLRTIAQSPNARVSSLPFSSPELPSLLAGGLSRDLDVQLDLGREVVGESLEIAPLANVLRPPGAALDDATLQQLSQTLVSTLVAGPSTVAPIPQPLGLAGPPTAGVGADGDLVAIVPDPAVMTILQSTLPEDDPVLAAQVLLGELAAIWQELPGERRGIALVLSEDLLLPPPFYGAFARGIAGAPWLTPMHAGEFAISFPPAEPSALAAPIPRRFASTYVEQLKQARRRVLTYRSMLVDPSEAPDRYDTMLLLAESRQYLSNPDDGLAFISTVRGSVDAVFNAISVDSADVITLTSRTGSGIPVTVSNGADEALQVTVRLVSTRLRETPSTDLALASGESQTVTFRVDAVATGRFQAELQVVAPGGRVLVREQLTVRSTVYNRIALVITIAAALLLLALWARRFLPRRTS